MIMVDFSGMRAAQELIDLVGVAFLRVDNCLG
jgi:hypothetical protein